MGSFLNLNIAKENTGIFLEIAKNAKNPILRDRANSLYKKMRNMSLDLVIESHKGLDYMKTSLQELDNGDDKDLAVLIAKFEISREKYVS